MSDDQATIAEIEAITADLASATDAFERDGDALIKNIHAELAAGDRELLAMLEDVEKIDEAQTSEASE